MGAVELSDDAHSKEKFASGKIDEATSLSVSHLRRSEANFLMSRVPLRQPFCFHSAQQHVMRNYTILEALFDRPSSCLLSA